MVKKINKSEERSIVFIIKEKNKPTKLLSNLTLIINFYYLWEISSLFLSILILFKVSKKLIHCCMCEALYKKNLLLYYNTDASSLYVSL